MPYELKLSSGSTIIVIRYYGKVDFETRLKALTDVTALLQKEKKKHLLIDVRDMDSELTTTQEYHFGTKLADSKELRGCRVAVLRKPESNENQFIDTVASNRGYLIKEFSSRDEAMHWLEG